MLAFEIYLFLVGLAVCCEWWVCPFKDRVFCNCYSMLSLSLRFKWLLIINLFYECVCIHTCICVHVCVCGGQKEKLGYCPQAYQLTLWCRVSHWSGAQQLYPTCLARELQESSCVLSTGIVCTQYCTWHFYVVGGVFVVLVCLLMECFSSSALAVMSNTTNFWHITICFLFVTVLLYIFPPFCPVLC